MKNRTISRTLYPELVDANIANSVEFTKKYSTYLASIGSLSYSDPGANNTSNETSVLQPPSLAPLRTYEDGSYELQVRVTAYSRNEPTSDIYTRQGLAALSKDYGSLKGGYSAAVDFNLIDPGSKISIPNLGSNFVAMDTGSAVVSRKASQKTGGQPVIDVYFETYEEQLQFERTYPAVQTVRIFPPDGKPPGTSIKPSAYTTPQNISASRGDLTPFLAISVDYWDAKKSGDPITKLKTFYENLDSRVFDSLNNDFVYYWVKKFNSSIDVIKSLVNVGEASYFNPPSDSIGILANVGYKLDDNSSPIWDFNTSKFGIPSPYPAQLNNKLSPATKTLAYELSQKNTQLMRNNLINLLFTTTKLDKQLKQIAADSTQPHGTNLVADTNFILTFNNSLSQIVENLKNSFDPELYEFICYFSNINDRSAYNPRDRQNLQLVENVIFDLDVEGVTEQLDLLQKRVKQSMSNRTIKNTISVERLNQAVPTPTTENLNNKFLSKNTSSTAPIPASLEFSLNKFKASSKIMQVPNAALQKANDIVDKISLENIPGINNAFSSLNDSGINEILGATGLGGLSPTSIFGNFNGIVNSFTAPLQESLGNITALASNPLSLITDAIKINGTNGIPNVLPSVNLGSFPEILSIVSNTNLKNLNPSSVIGLIEQTKNIICNFQFPIIGKIDIDSIVSVDFDPDTILQKLQSLLPKLPKKDDFKKLMQSLVPDFKSIFKNLYKKFFEC